MVKRLLLTILLCLIATPSWARNERPSGMAAGIAGFDTNIVWQTHDNGYLRSTVTNYGYFGTVRDRLRDSTGALVPVMESPANSGIEYLYEAGLWIGGVVGGDTLVSTGSLGFGIAHELYADGYEPGVRSDFLGDDEWTFVYGDTTTDPETVREDPYDGVHRPLPIRVRQKTYTFDTEVANSAVFMELVISNIGSNPIDDLWIGWLFDPDVGHPSRRNYWNDDLTGHSRKVLHTPTGDVGISCAWAVDNDGDPDESGQFTGRSARRVFGSMYLGGDQRIRSESYNWWVPSLRKDFDWGPQEAPGDTNRFGGRGFEVTDRFRYRVMSNQELDYPQPYAAVDMTSEGWMPPPPDSIAVDFADGFDIRCLHSVGVVSLAPGDSTTVHWVWCVADDAVRSSFNFATRFDPYNPSGFVSGLGIAALESCLGRLKEAWIERFQDVPVTSPREFKVSEWDDSSAVLTWNPQSASRIQGYQIVRTKSPLLSVPDRTYWLSADDSVFIDRGLDRLQEYGYTISCVGGMDQWGGLVATPSRQLRLVPDRSTAPSKPSLRAGSTVVTVRAGEQDDASIVGYRVYRRTPGHQAVELGSFNRGDQFSDNKVSVTNVYEYALSGSTSNGTASALSPWSVCAVLDLTGSPAILDFTKRNETSLTNKDSVTAAWINLVPDGQYIDGSVKTGLSLNDLNGHSMIAVVSDDRGSIPVGVDSVLSLYSVSGGRTLISGRDLFNYELALDKSVTLEPGSAGRACGIVAAYYPRSLLANPTRMNGEFVGSMPLVDGLPILSVDSTRTDWGLNPALPHPGNAIPFVGYFEIDTSVAEVLYVYESREGASSPLHGKPVAVMSKEPGRTLAVFAFPLSYIEESDAKASLAAVLARMGYGSTLAAGDADNDGVVTAADVVSVINYLYRDGYLINERNADVNGDCRVDVLDVVYLLDHVYHAATLPNMLCPR